ncbi:hypothetical protein CAEBREN_13515 [Caenorhabditis brenneri]|uniref:PAN-3 domain-containing protein n=1 Tax=Caenorhabditis brenneri TaxID=135651 RepID=G0M906_CAEBE|nr:hypothetical protein CAEBREN_13515 [Caenorhabditis brenneri]
MVPYTANDFKMIVTWGKPITTSPTSVLTISWDACLQKCWADTTCVFIHDTKPNCDYYTINNATSVQKLTASSGKRVAFRLLTNGSTCSGPAAEPILQDGTVKSGVDVNISQVNGWKPYSITLKNNVWTFATKTQPYYCLPPMQPIKRSGDIFCMLLWTPGFGTCINQTHANNYCKTTFNGNLPLAGPASQGEYDYVKELAIDFLTNPTSPLPAGYTKFGFWLDGVRKADCTAPQKAGVTCSGTNEFTFTDTHAKNPVLGWNNGQPDGLKGTNAGCVAILAQNGKAGVDDMA